MVVTAKLRYLRIAPRKVRLVADLIRGKSVEKSQTILNFTIKNAAKPMLKLLNSAVASAKNNFSLDSANLYISRITVDEGPKFKRWRPRARGQAYQIQKKTSHIVIELDEIKKLPQGARKAKGAAKKKTIKGQVQERVFVKTEKPRLKPKTADRTAAPKPKTEKGIQRIFRRKSF